MTAKGGDPTGPQVIYTNVSRFLLTWFSHPSIFKNKEETYTSFRKKTGVIACSYGSDYTECKEVYLQLWGELAFEVQQLFTEQKVIHEVRLVPANISLFVLKLPHMLSH